MKAYKVKFAMQMEGLECFCCDYGSCTPDYFMDFVLIVVNETASKARYKAITHIVDNYDMSDNEGVGELLKHATVRRTKRQYNYRQPHVKLIESSEDGLRNEDVCGVTHFGLFELGQRPDYFDRSEAITAPPTE